MPSLEYPKTCSPHHTGCSSPMLSCRRQDGLVSSRWVSWPAFMPAGAEWRTPSRHRCHHFGAWSVSQRAPALTPRRATTIRATAPALRVRSPRVTRLISSSCGPGPPYRAGARDRMRELALRGTRELRRSVTRDAPGSGMDLVRTKPVERSLEDVEGGERHLRRRLSALDLTVFGVGVVIGTGIFVLTGKAAKEMAGPAVALSFVAAGFVCALAALCYAEFASTVPVAGSAYTYSYATLGELPAWIIGWDLALELALGAAVVAVGWSQYFTSLLDSYGWQWPHAIGSTDSATLNLPAVLIVLLLTAVLVGGIKLSSRV